MLRKILILLILFSSNIYVMEQPAYAKNEIFNKPIPASLMALALASVIKNKIDLSILPIELKERAELIKRKKKELSKGKVDKIIQSWESHDLEGFLLLIDNSIKRFIAKQILLQAIYNNNIEVIKFFADRGAIIEKDLFNFYQTTKSTRIRAVSPLHEAARLGKYKEVRKLLRKQDNIDSMDHTWRSALCCAAFQCGNAKTLQVLLDHGANVNFRDWPDGETPLHNAAQAGSYKVIKKLLKNGANINLLDKNILYKVAKERGLASPTVKLLIEYGADMSAIKSKEKQTMLKSSLIRILITLKDTIVSGELDFPSTEDSDCENSNSNVNSDDENSSNSDSEASENSDKIEPSNLQDLINLLAQFNQPLTKALEPFVSNS